MRVGQAACDLFQFLRAADKGRDLFGQVVPRLDAGFSGYKLCIHFGERFTRADLLIKGRGLRLRQHAEFC